MKRAAGQRDRRTVPSASRGRRIAVFRPALGQAQMFAATLAAIFLLKTGASTLTIVTAVTATSLTPTSLILRRMSLPMGTGPPGRASSDRICHRDSPRPSRIRTR
jgi:hypothetical protein